MPDRLGNPSDNEGVTYVANRPWPMAPRPWFAGPDTPHVACPRCHNPWFGVLASDRPFIQIFCPKCSFAWGPMEIHKPQMTDSVAHDMGMKTAVKAIQEDMDIPLSELPDEQ